jgi:queuine tRNA-ribosyltransferase
MLSPEKSIEVQQALGSDIMMAFDECAPYPADREYVKPSMELTTRWLRRCKDAWTNRESQALFGIMQGGMYRDLREQSAKDIVDLDLPGYAIGGLSVGEPKEVMCSVLDYATDLLPVNKPRYLMGVGTPENIIEGVYRGVDFFDCVMPSRNARHGFLFTWEGTVNLNNKKHERDSAPISASCGCPTCRNYSKGYIRHLLKSKEMLGMRLAVMHNLYFYNELMQRIRDALDAGDYQSFYNRYATSLSKRAD